MAVPEDAIIVEAVAVNPERNLTAREKAAYDFTVRMSPPAPAISPHKEAELFALFLQGQDCVEIARLNKGISLGQIIRSRVENKWDEKRAEHLDSLLRETRARIQQSALESVDFITTQLAAAHKLYGDKVKKFIASGNPEDLGGFSIHGWKSYKEAVEILKSVTGADKAPQKHIHDHTLKSDAPVPAVNRAMTSVEASTVIKSQLAARKKQ